VRRENEEIAMESLNDTSSTTRILRRALSLRRGGARSRRRTREGMTLVEIMIVVIIMAMIAAAVGVAVLPRLNDARIQQARTDAQSRSAAPSRCTSRRTPARTAPRSSELT
jgi:prepilin-type N-terminal cleavage/methylation domain-containing protein